MTGAELAHNRATRDELAAIIAGMRPRRHRSMLAFAEEEIIVPAGPFEGLRFSAKRQPFARCWFDAVDSGRWNRFVALGPVQTGKTLIAGIIPVIHGIFELGETVVFGLPDMSMAADKWRNDLLPVIERTKYRDLLPRRGAGSRGGTVEAVRFANGAELKFMSGGGSDKSRAAYTARIICITEVDGLARGSARSVETDQAAQIEARSDAYPTTKRVFIECIVSTKEGRIWEEYERGTASRIVMRCPKCRDFVLPEREHLRGWRDADDELAAGDRSRFYCPSCAVPWDEDDRRAALSDLVLLHSGQTVGDDGVAQGDARRTDTLGFRWSSVHSRFTTAAVLGRKEWRAAAALDEDNAERAQCQYVWSTPYESKVREMVPLDIDAVLSRTRAPARGMCPTGTDYITVGVDLGKYLAHWAAIAWRRDGTAHVIDYGREEVASVDIGTDPALMGTMRALRERFDAGWFDASLGDRPRSPDQVWIDAGWHPSTVHAFCREAAAADPEYQLYRPCIGRGRSLAQREHYRRPTQTGNIVVQIGDEFHFVYLKNAGLVEAMVNSDAWKTWLHGRLSVAVGKPGAMTIYDTDRKTHISYAKHLTAEKETEEFDARIGLVTRWTKVRESNHWLDASYYACAAASLCGVRLIQEHIATDPSPAPASSPGREVFPFLISER
jgi:phage terminase large subunit GpA-like protein